MDIEEIYNEYFKDVYRFILRLSGDEHTAEDITCETFFKALKGVDKFRGECDARVWLCQIAKNCYYSYIKKQKRTVSIEDAGELSDAKSVEEDVVKRLDAERINSLLHTLPEPYKEVFMWRVYAELSFKQIAGIFKKTDNWACVTFHRAKMMILTGLEENGTDG